MSTRILRHLHLWSCVALCSLPCAAAPAQDALAQLQLEARLFQSTSGTFSADVLAPGGPELWNVVTGPDSSTAMLVVVAVKLAPGAVLRAQTPVRLIAREQATRGGHRRILLDRSLPLGALARGGTTHLAFWLQGTGCRPLDLQVTMRAADAAAPLSAAATVPFACGE
ncbi:MAG: hypothetical protein KGJ30_09135 [Burkholderiales bacterium]|nr:hypothetical protein [Burkholderiales bacterium]